MLSKLGKKYYINCFIRGQVTESELPGSRLQRSQFTFQGVSLVDICETMEAALEGYEILYHSDVPVKPGPEHTHVSYELLPRMEDPNSTSLFKYAKDLLKEMYMNYRREIQ